MTEKELLKNLGIRVRELRKSRGLSQQQLAELLGVSDPMISNLENGKKSIKIINLYTLSEVFDVTIDYLLKGIGKFYEIHSDTALKVADKKDN